MQLHKLVIFAMLLALLSVLAVPTHSFAHTIGAGTGSEQYTLEPLDGHSASMRDMAGPGVQFFANKSKSITKYITSHDAAGSQYWISEVSQGHLPQQTTNFIEADQTRSLWLINRALLI